MAWMAAALPYISAASTALAVQQQISTGKTQEALATVDAMQKEEDAKAAQAEAQREAAIERKKARNLASRARAISAASGGGASDPTVTNILTDIETQGEVNALNALYSGNTLARGLNAGAAIARREGTAARHASQYRAASTALSGGESWYEKYGT